MTDKTNQHPQKLSLARATLRRLDAHDLVAVRGGLDEFPGEEGIITRKAKKVTR